MWVGWKATPNITAVARSELVQHQERIEGRISHTGNTLNGNAITVPGRPGAARADYLSG
jgi:hypothetical protein